MTDNLTRRSFVAGVAVAGVAGVAAATGVIGFSDDEGSSAKDVVEKEKMGVEAQKISATLPAIYLPHGGGPWPWMTSFQAGMSSLRAYLERLPSMFSEAPKAILCVTAHWEEAVPTVSTAVYPPMLYDYSGFPAHTYKIKWPAPGSPGVAARVRELLGAAGIESGEDAKRGFDHGTFVPLAVAWPKAEIPTVQLSLVRGLDPETHLKIGRALRPLRDEGVLIVGSGMSYHNLPGFRKSMRAGGDKVQEDAQLFDAWLEAAVHDSEREEMLRSWAKAPAARACHPREEHLLPLMVVSGAAMGEAATLPFREEVMGLRVSAVHYG